jgi:hypothetical protein
MLCYYTLVLLRTGDSLVFKTWEECLKGLDQVQEGAHYIITRVDSSPYLHFTTKTVQRGIKQ